MQLVTKSIQRKVVMAQIGARTRLLANEDVERVVEACRAFKRYCKKTGLLFIGVTGDGGAIPNNYRWRGESTCLYISPAGVRAERMGARTVPGGKGMTIRCTARKDEDDQRMGKKWTDYPPMTFKGRKYQFNNKGHMYTC